MIGSFCIGESLKVFPCCYNRTTALLSYLRGVVIRLQVRYKPCYAIYPSVFKELVTFATMLQENLEDIINREFREVYTP